MYAESEVSGHYSPVFELSDRPGGNGIRSLTTESRDLGNIRLKRVLKNPHKEDKWVSFKEPWPGGSADRSPATRSPAPGPQLSPPLRKLCGSKPAFGLLGCERFYL